MTAPATSTYRSYLFGPAEPAAGTVLGLSPGQWVMNAAAISAGLQVINPATSWRSTGVATVAGLLCLGWAYLPVRGRTPVGWTRVYALYRWQRWRGQDEYVGGLFRMGKDELEIPDARLPGALGATRFLQLATAPSEPPIVIAHDTREHTYTAVIALEGEAFHLMEAVDQELREEAWSLLLASLCRPGRQVKRLQVMKRTVPDTSDTLRRDFRTRAGDTVELVESVDEHDLTDAELAGDPMTLARLLTGRAYEQLTDAAGAAGRRHETYVAVAIDGKAVARDISKAGGGDLGAAAVVASEIRALTADLTAAGVTVLGWAPPRLLGYVLRTAYDPASIPMLDQRGGGRGDVAGGHIGLPSGVDLRQAGPHRAKNGWSAYRADSAFHRAYWCAEWPRKAAPAAFLTPLLMYADSRCTISLIYEPRDARAAQRGLAKKMDKAEGESGIRNWMRLRRSKRAEQNHAHLDRRENELLAGEQLLALRAVITISAATLDELDAAEADVLSLAQQCLIELQPMTGCHDTGFAVGAVPLARGF